MHKLIASLSIIFSLSAFSQSTMLFKISGKDLVKPSYVFGTMHTADDKAFTFGDPVFDAIESCDYAAFEIDFMNSSQSEMREQIMEDPKIKEMIEYLQTELKNRMKAELDPMTFGLKVMKMMPQLKDALKNYEGGEGSRLQAVDIFLESYARHYQKPIIGIESVSEQLQVLLDFDKKIMADKIIDFLKRPDWDSTILSYFGATEQLKSVYASMKLDSICYYVNSTVYSAEFMEKFLDKRNLNMVERVLPTMKKGSVFMAIGAAHLCGTQGILNLLKQKGYVVTPIALGKTAQQPVTFIWQKNERKESGFAVETANALLAVDTSDDLDYIDFTETIESAGEVPHEAAVNEPEEDEIKYAYYKVSDTTRQGLIHFNLSYGYDPELLEIAESIDYDDEEEEVEAIEMDDTPVAVEENIYGEDHVGEAVLEEDLKEEEMKNGMTAEQKAEMAESLKQMMNSLIPQEKTDTLWLTGKSGKIKVIKKELAGRISYESYITNPKQSDMGWNLNLSGDPALMKNEAVMRFFTSFTYLN